jgi:hypothetical protein
VVVWRGVVQHGGGVGVWDGASLADTCLAWRCCCLLLLLLLPLLALLHYAAAIAIPWPPDPAAPANCVAELYCLQGACGTCASSAATMKMGIERSLKATFGPQLLEVLQVRMLASGLHLV